MAASSNKKAEMEGMFEKLDSQVQAGQLKKASKTVDQILQLDNVHPTALHVKGALLAQTGKHEELLKFLEKPSGQRVVGELAFEKAYCLYRLGRFQEALQALEQVGEDRVQGKLHLQAQLNHRLGRSKESIAAYQELSTKHADQSLELQTNVLAAYVENGRSQEIPQVMEAMKISADKSYEIAFNQACGLVATGELAEAEQHLLLALRIGQETLFSEDFTAAEVDEEMGPVNAQLAFVSGNLGRRSEAAGTLEEVIKVTKNDPATHAVAESNLAASRIADSKKKAAMVECLKRLEALMARVGVPSNLDLKPELQLRLTEAQQRALHFNRALLNLHVEHTDSAKQILAAMSSKWPQDQDRVVLLQAALLAREGKAAEADALLAEAQQASDAASSVDALLLRCQLLAAENPKRAAELLESVQDKGFSFSPGVVSTKLALLRRTGVASEASELISSATAFWSAKADSEASKKEALIFLLTAESEVHFQAGRMQAAAESLTKLRKLCPDDMSLLVKLAKATATFDPEATAELARSLPVPEGVGEADVEGELQAILAKGRKSDGKRKGAPGEGGKSRKKRNRKPILPKGFDPANPGPPPDPERWLPKTQRSDFRKKKRGQHLRAQQTTVKGSQGAGKVDENLDRSSAAADAGASSSAPAQQERGKSGKKGKKGKR